MRRGLGGETKSQHKLHLCTEELSREPRQLGMVLDASSFECSHPFFSYLLVAGSNGEASAKHLAEPRLGSAHQNVVIIVTRWSTKRSRHDVLAMPVKVSFSCDRKRTCRLFGSLALVSATCLAAVLPWFCLRCDLRWP